MTSSVCRVTGAHLPESEVHDAQEKFVESKDLAETAMFNLLENDVSIPLLHVKAVFQSLLGLPYAILWPGISFGRVRPRRGGGVNFQQRVLPGLPGRANRSCLIQRLFKAKIHIERKRREHHAVFKYVIVNQPRCSNWFGPDSVLLQVQLILFRTEVILLTFL